MQEEISLKELILVLFKGWKFIITTTVLALLVSITGMYFLNSTSYIGVLTGNLTLVNQYDTVYGPFNPGFASNVEQLNKLNDEEFINLVKRESKIDEDIQLLVSAPDGVNFTIQYSSSNTESIKSILETTQKYMEDYLNYDIQVTAIKNLGNAIKAEIKREQKVIKIHQSFIDRLVVKRNQTDTLLSIYTINPAFDLIHRQITNLEIDQLRAIDRISILEIDLGTLKSIKYDDFSTYLKNKLNFEDVSVEIMVSPEIIINSVSRFNSLLMITISSMLGALFGIFVVFFIQYWKSN